MHWLPDRIVSKAGRRLARHAISGVLYLLAVRLAIVTHTAGDFEFNARQVGQWPGYSRGPAQQIALYDHYACVRVTLALLIFDVSDPRSPKFVAEYAPGRLTIVTQGFWGKDFVRFLPD